MAETNPPRCSEAVAQGLSWLQDHGDLLYAYALSRVRSAELAEELVQETFLAALRHEGDFQNRSSESTWLIGILRHKLADHFRQAQRRAGPEQVPAESTPHDPICPAEVDAIDCQEFHVVLRGCLDDLPPLVRQAFEFRVIDQLDIEEVCGILEIQPNNLAARLYRARVALRQCLQLRWFS